MTNIGDGTVDITGGEVTGGDGTVTLRNVTPSIDVIPDQFYTGKEITPVLVVRDNADIMSVIEHSEIWKSTWNEKAFIQPESVEEIVLRNIMTVMIQSLSI